MRWLLGTLIVVVAVTACSPSAVRPTSSPEAATPTPARTAAQPVPTNRVVDSPRFPAINPVTLVQGRVTFVNERFRFVIVDFAFHQMPRLEQRLGVYRRDVRVGEIRISGPSDGTTVVADVMSGAAGLGDQVREDSP